MILYTFWCLVQMGLAITALVIIVPDDFWARIVLGAVCGTLMGGSFVQWRIAYTEARNFKRYIEKMMQQQEKFESELATMTLANKRAREAVKNDK